MRGVVCAARAKPVFAFCRRPNGFARYRDAVEREVEEKVERASAEAKKRKSGLKDRAKGRGGGK